MNRPVGPTSRYYGLVPRHVRTTVSTFRCLSGLAREMYAEQSALRFAKKWTYFCAFGLSHRYAMIAYARLLKRTRLLTIYDHLPLVAEKPLKPYVCANWTVKERFEELMDHYQVIDAVFGDNLNKIYSTKGYELSRFTTNAGDTFTIELFPGYLNEGSLGIRLCTQEGREVYSLSFHLSVRSTPTCYIGAIQGPNERIADRQAQIVTITKSLHGLRPKALMVESLYCVLNQLGYKRILGVTKQAHVYASKGRWRNEKSIMAFDINALWHDFHAVETDNGFVQLPPSPIRKPIKLIKSNKRSLYKKRYAWLQSLSRDVECAMLGVIIKNQPPDHHSDQSIAKAA